MEEAVPEPAAAPAEEEEEAEAEEAVPEPAAVLGLLLVTMVPLWMPLFVYQLQQGFEYGRQVAFLEVEVREVHPVRDCCRQLRGTPVLDGRWRLPLCLGREC